MMTMGEISIMKSEAAKRIDVYSEINGGGYPKIVNSLGGLFLIK